MKKYAIVADSCCDLNKEFRTKHHIDYAHMSLTWTDKNGVLHDTFADMDWEVISPKDFYDTLRSGIRIYTAQTTVQDYLDVFEPHLQKGEDVLYLACSSGLSASINVAKMLAENDLKEKYPNNRLVVIDTLRAGMAQGMIIMEAVRLQEEEGKSIDEVAEIIEKIKTSYKEVGIPETLTYLKRAGRVNGPTALMGNLISLKPILVFDEKGVNQAKEKAIGRKKAYLRMAEMIRDDIVDPENQEIYLMSADCRPEDIQMFKDAILKQVKVKNIIIEPLGPIIGASSGPGTIIVNYRGKQ